MSDFSNARRKMVDGQVRPNDVTDLGVLEALLSVARENFVPDHLRPVAYLDLDIDLGGEGASRAFLIKTVTLARMLQAAEIAKTDKVLIVGCPTGYTAAVVAHLADQVVSVNHTQVSGAVLPGVKTVSGSAVQGSVADGPFDVIVIAGASEIVPDALYDQLADGGRLVVVSAVHQPPRAILVARTGHDFGSRPIFDAAAPVVPGFERLPEFVF